MIIYNQISKKVQKLKPQSTFSVSDLADVLGTSKRTIQLRIRSGRIPFITKENGEHTFSQDQLRLFPEGREFLSRVINGEVELFTPLKKPTVVELFAGCGGLALGLESAGFEKVCLNEWDAHACATLRLNRPAWNVIEGDISDIDFTPYFECADVVSGGFPCQAFSYAGNKLGFEDVRGTMFFEFARCVREVNPKILLAENVRGLLTHDKGRTLETIKGVIDDLGYHLFTPKVLKAIYYEVPQKRERLIIVGIRKDLMEQIEFIWPQPIPRIFHLDSALKAGDLFDQDVPDSQGQKYPPRKAEIMQQVPEGGYWRDLPENLQKEYMAGSFFLSGGKTGMARRLSWDEPSLTLTCAPAQKQTERCHPEYSRPLTVREYARIQTFPDSWTFSGSVTQQYKQIGNAVPVNLGYHIGLSIADLLAQVEGFRRKPVTTNGFSQDIGQMVLDIGN